MKKILKYTLIYSIISLSSISCNRDLLDPQPQTSVPDVGAFDTESRISSQLLSVYQGLKAGNFYGGRFVVYGDIRGENFLNQTSNLVTGSDVWALNPTNSATAVVGLWQYAYETINRANIFIAGMQEIGNNVVGPEVGNGYIAEAKLIRALSYFSLLQYYARPYADGNGNNPGLPLRLTPITGPGESDMARSSVAEVYAQILTDLNDAENGLALTNGSEYNNTTRAHRNTAIALKTRVYLTMQDYPNVITEANKIVSSDAPFTAPTGVTHALQPDIATVFTNYTTTESIFSMPMTSTSGDYPGTQNGLAYYWTPGSSSGGVGNGEYALNPNGIIANSNWKSSDARRAFVMTNANGSNWLMKFKAPSPYTDYVPVIRYAEVLLNLAEAKVRSTNQVDPQAVALLNAVHNRSDKSTTYTTANFASASQLIDAIMLERNIEFLGEGLRNNDLVRLLETIPAKGTVPAKSADQNGYIWPISANELSLNNLMTDN